MLHACFVSIPTCFMCTFIHFLAFSGTNILTRCRSASSCFLPVLYFRKSCTGNILGIARDKNPGPYFSVMKPDLEGEQHRASRVARHGPGAARPVRAPVVCLGPPGLHRLRPSPI